MHQRGAISKVVEVHQSVQNNVSWDICANCIHMVELVLVALREFDGKGSCMGKAWLVMKTLEKHVQLLVDPLISFPLELTTSVKSQFQC